MNGTATELEATNPDAIEDGTERDQPDEYGDPESGGDLLEMEPTKVPEFLIRKFEDQEPVMQSRKVQWEVNRLRRKGVPNVKVKIQDGRHSVWKSPHVQSPDAVPVTNKAADLCSKLESFLFADPPASEVIPPSGEDDDIQGAETSTRVLEDIQGETGLNEVAKARRAWSRASSYASAFEYYFIDPRGGGRVPMKIEAGFDPQSKRQAEHVSEALQDPMTGIDWPDFKPRYVRKDGSLTDDVAEAASRWAPKLRSEVLTGLNVRLIPHTAEDIWDADAAIIAGFMPWGECKRNWAELCESIEATKGADGEGDRYAALFNYRPTKAEDLLGPGQRKRDLEPKQDADEHMIFYLMYYHPECYAYPKGAKVVVLGKTELAERGRWSAEVDGKQRKLSIPLTQYKQLDDGEDSPYGVAMMQKLGSGNELIIAAWAAFVHHLDRQINRKTFIPTTSPIHPKHLQHPGYRYLPMTPGGEPKTEDVGELPTCLLEAIDRATLDLESASRMQQTAQGLEAGGVDSGRHAYAIISQVHANLSEMVYNIERAWTRGGRIALEQVQAFYSIEQQLRYRSDDGEWQVKAWRGADLVDTTDVRLKPGTLTLMTPMQKENQAKEYQQYGMLAPHELREIIRSNMGGRIGLEDDPHYLRIRRQIARWREGPPKDWEPQKPPMVPVLDDFGAPIGERPATDPMTGEPLPPPPDPVLSVIWAMSPADELPEVAQLRLHELAKAMAGKKYSQFPVEWRAAIDQEFAHMSSIVYPPAPIDPATGAPVVAPQETPAPEAAQPAPAL